MKQASGSRVWQILSSRVGEATFHGIEQVKSDTMVLQILHKIDRRGDLCLQQGGGQQGAGSWEGGR